MDYYQKSLSTSQKAWTDHYLDMARGHVTGTSHVYLLPSERKSTDNDTRHNINLVTESQQVVEQASSEVKDMDRPEQRRLEMDPKVAPRATGSRKKSKVLKEAQAGDIFG